MYKNKPTVKAMKIAGTPYSINEFGKAFIDQEYTAQHKQEAVSPVKHDHGNNDHITNTEREAISVLYEELNDSVTKRIIDQGFLITQIRKMEDNIKKMQDNIDDMYEVAKLCDKNILEEYRLINGEDDFYTKAIEMAPENCKNIEPSLLEEEERILEFVKTGKYKD